MVCKNISRSKDASYTKPLSDAGAVSALVKLLDVEKDLEDGSAELLQFRGGCSWLREKNAVLIRF